MSDAVVLAGAVAKGAFSAGALSVLSQPDVKMRLAIDVTRIVGASSGALNAVFYANAIRSDAEVRAGARLAELWIEHASVHGAMQINLPDVITERGISDAGKILALLRRYVPPSPSARAIDLRLVVTNADGELVDAEGLEATTFEYVISLAASDLETEAAIERAYLAAAASAALPVLYAPVSVQLGARAVQGLDGGLLNDDPLGLALADAPEISRIFVIIPHARVQNEPADLRGRALVSHVFDMIVRERVVRSARAVARVNRVLQRLEHVLPDPAQREAVLEAFGWTGRRVAQVIEIRPDVELPGDAFSNFWSRELREHYVQAGVAAAQRALRSGPDAATP